ncbi:unnamed protein product, partial [Oppiella nova]
LDLFQVTVKCGLQNRDFNVSQVILYETFNQISEHNIALLKLDGLLELGTNDTDKIDLPEQGSDVPADTIVTLTGWGYTGTNLSLNLQTVDVPILDRHDCVTQYNSYKIITENMICTGLHVVGDDICNYDIGGPVIMNNLLVGIVSWGNECASPLYPGVFTKVGNFVDR